MSAVEVVRNVVNSGLDRVVRILDEWSTCPACKHATDTPGCRCERTNCACGGGVR